MRECKPGGEPAGLEYWLRLKSSASYSRIGVRYGMVVGSLFIKHVHDLQREDNKDCNLMWSYSQHSSPTPFTRLCYVVAFPLDVAYNVSVCHHFIMH